MTNVNRVVDILRTDGISGLVRGIRDWIFYSSFGPYLVSLWDERELVIGDTKIKFKIYNYESIRRSLGHGEQEVIEDLLSRVKETDVVWDVGANQGTYSLFAATKCDEVIAFEPNKSACEIISANAELNGVEITIQEYGLGAEEKEVVLREADRSGVRWTADSGAGDSIKIRPGREVSQANPTVLKIDTEGDELEVLEGLDDVLSGVRLCYVEWHDDNYEAVRSELKSAGFEMANITDNIIRGIRVE